MHTFERTIGKEDRFKLEQRKYICKHKVGNDTLILNKKLTVTNVNGFMLFEPKYSCILKHDIENNDLRVEIELGYGVYITYKIDMEWTDICKKNE